MKKNGVRSVLMTSARWVEPLVGATSLVAFHPCDILCYQQCVRMNGREKVHRPSARGEHVETVLATVLVSDGPQGSRI